jgi:hypothetical protein
MGEGRPVLGIVGGTGREGFGLALRLGRAGYDVLIGSREPARAAAAAAEANRRLGIARICGFANAEIVKRSEIVFLTVPFSAQRETLLGLRDQLSGKILVDVTVPLLPESMEMVCLPPEGSAARIAQTVLGNDVHVVSAFQNVSSQHLSDLDREIGCDILVCGDDAGAREAVIRLAAAMGARAWDAGPLENAAATEALTSALIAVCRNHGLRNAGIQIIGQPWTTPKDRRADST